MLYLVDPSPCLPPGPSGSLSSVPKRVLVGDLEEYYRCHQTELGFQSGSAPSHSRGVIVSKWPELSELQFMIFMRVRVEYKAFVMHILTFMHVVRK